MWKVFNILLITLIIFSSCHKKTIDVNFILVNQDLSHTPLNGKIIRKEIQFIDRDGKSRKQWEVTQVLDENGRKFKVPYIVIKHYLPYVDPEEDDIYYLIEGKQFFYIDPSLYLLRTDEIALIQYYLPYYYEDVQNYYKIVFPSHLYSEK